MSDSFTYEERVPSAAIRPWVRRIWSYTRTEAVPFFDEPQIARVQRTARQLVKRRELVVQP